MKRFTDTNKWTTDRWFGELDPKYKLFWMFLVDACDNVGVWEVNMKMANFLIGYEYSMDTLSIVFEEKVQILENGAKWYIKSFVKFQHGELDRDSKSKPIQSYIALMESHSLPIPYAKGIHTLQGKGKGKGEGKGKGKGKGIDGLNKETDQGKATETTGSPAFTPPTIAQVNAYSAERSKEGYEAINAEAFIDFYQSKGWKIGNNAMEDWKASARNWGRNNKPKDEYVARAAGGAKIYDL